jgi:hypothetical protein
MLTQFGGMCVCVFVCEETRRNLQLQCHDMNAIITRNISFLVYYSSQREIHKQK